MSGSKVYLILAALTLLFCILCFVWGYGRGYKNGAECTNTTRVDTLVIRDTFVQYSPIEVEKREVCKVYLPVDTVRLHDTLYVEVTREQKVYRDTNYTAWVSGILPALDSIQIYNTTKIVTKYQVRKAPRFGFSAQLGFGGMYGIVNHCWDVGPYLGVGVHYKF